MISVRCDQCQNEAGYAPWLAGMRVQCKSCKAWLNIPRPEGSPPPTPAAVVVAVPPRPVSRPVLPPSSPSAPSWRQTVADAEAEKTGVPPRPPGVADAVLVGWLNDAQAAGATPGELEQELIGRGCSPGYAGQFVARFLRGDIRGERSLHVVAGALSITGLEGMTDDDLRADLKNGGRFVVYHYCVSAIFVTFMKPTNIRYIPSNRSRFAGGLGCTLTSLFLGLWGIPWGIIYTISCVVGNSTGGTNVTGKVVNTLGWRVTPDHR